MYNLKSFLFLFIACIMYHCSGVQGKKATARITGDESYRQFVDKFDSLQWIAHSVFLDSIGNEDYFKNDSINTIIDKDSIAFGHYIDSLEAITGLLKKQIPYTLEYRMAAILKKYLSFDAYLESFDKLSVEKGWKIDYTYVYNSDSVGRPVIIAIRDTVDFDKFVSRLGAGDEIIAYSKKNPYLDHVIIDGSITGYFQFCILSEWGDHFAWYSNKVNDINKPGDGLNCSHPDIALYSNAGYGISGVNNGLVCSYSTLENVLDIFTSQFHSNDEQLKKIKEINPYPIVIVNNDNCEVRLVRFKIHGGFIEEKYKISTSFPHKCNLTYFETIVESSGEELGM